ncbi:MAG TPA: alpha-L-fucosidase [Terracidiphilus sp.]|nr:alpha-L-fucosidase [Terracidiphilus sp.]
MTVAQMPARFSDSNVRRGKWRVRQAVDRMMVTRRRFLSGTIAAAAPLAFAGNAFAPAGEPRALGTPDQLAWQDLEFGMFVHFAPNTWQNREYDDLSTPLSAINPDIDTDNWAQCAVNLGARYVVFVAKHAGGFCMWQTATTPYSIGHTPWQGGHGDVLRDIAASCRKYGLRLGVYISPRDAYLGAGDGGVCKTPEKQAQYNAIYRQQLTEVLSRYGEMVEVWFDGSTVAAVADIVSEYARHAAIFQGPSATIRWVGNENGFAPYPLWDAESIGDARSGVSTALDSDPDGGAWMPVECDVSIRRPNWFWSTTNVKNLMTPDQLLEVYYRSVGRGAQLLLNVPPNRNGHIADEDFVRAKEFGAEIRRRFGKSIAESAGSGGILALDLPQPARVDHVILQEDCRFGQRVRGFRVEGRADGQWIELIKGSSIGHKRIVPVTPHVGSTLRLVVTQSQGEARIRRFAAFNTGAEAPTGWDAPTQLWAPNAVGKWTDFHFGVDLSKQITAAAQYRLRFIPESGDVREIGDVRLLLNGVSEPRFIREDPAAKNALILTITALGEKISVSGTIAGAASGTILLQKM